MQYRREVDGLRALAVVPVILFHAGIDRLSGGFVGVDIFFVISGYLITYLLLEEHASGSFSLVHFYERRIRRILPALFFLLLCIIPLAWLWLLPSQFKEFSQSIIAVVLFVSNLFFYLKTGYFSSAIDEKPLIHTWSLAVEEQFYIFFPLLLLLLWRFCRQKLALVLTVIGVLSYLLAEFASRTYPQLSFYLMPTRAWELMAGALCAVYLFQREKLLSKAPLAWLGLLMILVSFFWINKSLPFPSFYTAVPVAGTCLILLFGHNTPVARLLSLRIIVVIGLLSYSAYLWHQPLFAFARIIFLGEPALWVMLLLTLLTFAVAGFSWRFIEQPFRQKTQGKPRIPAGWVFSLAAVVATLLLDVGALAHVKQGFHDRFSMPATVADTIARSTNAYACFDLSLPHKSEKWGCDIGDADVAKNYDFVVWGDSHLLVTYNAFVSAAKNTGQKGFYVGIRQCLPFLGIHALRYDQQERNCNQLNQRVFDFVKENNIPKIILVSRWSYYATGGYDGDDFSYVGLTPDAKKDPLLSRTAFDFGLQKTIEAYSDIGVDVVLMEQVPQQRIHPEAAYYRAYAGGQDDVGERLRRLSVTKASHLAMQSYAMEQLNSIAQSHDYVSVLTMTDLFCQTRCLLGTETKSFYFDEDHLSVEGAKVIVERVESALMD